MSENLIPNNMENDKYNLNIEESDYKKLIIRMKEIKRTITLLEKIIFR